MIAHSLSIQFLDASALSGCGVLIFLHLALAVIIYKNFYELSSTPPRCRIIYDRNEKSVHLPTECRKIIALGPRKFLRLRISDTRRPHGLRI